MLDPHGDLCDDVLARIPSHRRDDVILLDPSDEAFPIGLNILQTDDEADRDRIVSDFIGLLMRLYDPHNYAIVGPIFPADGAQRHAGGDEPSGRHAG
ncbi:MAG: hypothetical protein IPK19_37520 [Chloroflexi bacterium]|nr:hypothetical protein [Chloroflexota bacterium]